MSKVDEQLIKVLEEMTAKNADLEARLHSLEVQKSSSTHEVTKEFAMPQVFTHDGITYRFLPIAQKQKSVAIGNRLVPVSDFINNDALKEELISSASFEKYGSIYFTRV